MKDGPPLERVGDLFESAWTNRRESALPLPGQKAGDSPAELADKLGGEVVYGSEGDAPIVIRKGDEWIAIGRVPFKTGGVAAYVIGASVGGAFKPAT